MKVGRIEEDSTKLFIFPPLKHIEYKTVDLQISTNIQICRKTNNNIINILSKKKPIYN